MRARPRLELLAAGALLAVTLACTGSSAGGAGFSGERMIASATGPIELGDAPVRVVLAPADEAGVASILGALEPGRRVEVVLHDLAAAAQPGVLYHLYIDLPEGTEPAADDPRHVGILNFFGIAPAEGGGQPPGSAAAPRRFDASAAAAAMAALGTPRDPLTLTIRPHGTPDLAARPRIGRIELVVR